MSERMTSILGWATLAALMVALWLLFGEDPTARQGARGGPLYEEGAALIERAAQISLKAEGESTTLQKAEGGWVIVERDGFAATKGAAEDFLRGLILSKRREPKTMRRENFPRLGLGEKALKAVLSDAKGGTLTELEIGTRSEGRTGRSLTYVFRSGDTRAWLVSDISALEALPSSWVDGGSLKLDSRRLKSANLGGTVLVRSDADSAPALKGLVEGEVQVADWQRRGDFTTLAELEFTDVRKLANPLVDPFKTISLASFDGLVYRITLLDLAPDADNADSAANAVGDLWFQLTTGYDVSLAEEGAAGIVEGAIADGAREAERLNALSLGWVFKPNDALQAVLLKRRSDFIDAAVDENGETGAF